MRSDPATKRKANRSTQPKIMSKKQEPYSQLQGINALFADNNSKPLESFVKKNRLPLRNLPPDILEVLRAGKIAYTKAIALSKVKGTVTLSLNGGNYLNGNIRELKTLIQEMGGVETKDVAPIDSKINTVLIQLRKNTA